MLIYAVLWMNLENKLKEGKHKRPEITWFHLYEMSWTRKSLEMKNVCLIFARTGEFVGKSEVTVHGYGMFLSGLIKMNWNYIVVMVVQFCEYTKNHWIVYCKGWILWNMNSTSIKLLFLKCFTTRTWHLTEY